MSDNTVRYLRFLVEEPSMKDFLNRLLPRFVEVEFEIVAFNGKHDLLKNLPSRLSGLKRSLISGQYIFVLVDRDSEDCHSLKLQLENMARDAGLITRSASCGQEWELANRIVIEELEAWYFGDWEAVCAAYANAPKNLTRRQRYRNPDSIKGGTWEAFEKVMKSEFPGGLRKREAARRIGEQIDPRRSTSHSFKVFYETVLEAAA